MPEWHPFASPIRKLRFEKGVSDGSSVTDTKRLRVWAAAGTTELARHCPAGKNLQGNQNDNNKIVLQIKTKTTKKKHVNEPNPKSKRNWDGVLINPGWLLSQRSLIEEYFLRQHHKGLHVLYFPIRAHFISQIPPFSFPHYQRASIITPNQESPPFKSSPTPLYGAIFVLQDCHCELLSLSGM